MLIEGYIAIVLLVIFAVVGLVKIIDDGFGAWRQEREDRDDTRLLMRMNMNGLLERMSVTTDPLEIEMLRQAYADSCGEYRRLCR